MCTAELRNHICAIISHNTGCLFLSPLLLPTVVPPSQIIDTTVTILSYQFLTLGIQCPALVYVFMSCVWVGEEGSSFS